MGSNSGPIRKLDANYSNWVPANNYSTVISTTTSMHLSTAVIQLAQLTHKCPLLIEDDDGLHRPHKHDSQPNEWRVLAAQDQNLSSAPFSRNNLWAEKYTVRKIKDQKWWKRRQNEFQKLLLHFHGRNNFFSHFPQYFSIRSVSLSQSGCSATHTEL